MVSVVGAQAQLHTAQRAAGLERVDQHAGDDGADHGAAHRQNDGVLIAVGQLFQNGFVVPNIDIPLDSDGCNARVNMRASYRPVSLSVDNYHDGYMLTKEDIKELEPVIGEKNAAKLKYSVAEEKFDLSSSNAGYPQNPPETQRKPDEAGMQDAFYVMKSNFQKVLGFCKLEDYGDKTKQEITDLITEKAKHYIHKDSIDFWMKNPNPLDIKEGNDLPDFEIARRVMTEE